MGQSKDHRYSQWQPQQQQTQLSTRSTTMGMGIPRLSTMLQSMEPPMELQTPPSVAMIMEEPPRSHEHWRECALPSFRWRVPTRSLQANHCAQVRQPCSFGIECFRPDHIRPVSDQHWSSRRSRAQYCCCACFRLRRTGSIARWNVGNGSRQHLWCHRSLLIWWILALSLAIVLTPGGFEIVDAYAVTDAAGDPTGNGVNAFNNAFGYFLAGWFIFTTLLLICTLRSTVA